MRITEHEDHCGWNPWVCFSEATKGDGYLSYFSILGWLKLHSWKYFFFFFKFLLMSFLIWLGYVKRDFDIPDVSSGTEALFVTCCKICSLLKTVLKICFHIYISVLLGEKKKQLTITTTTTTKKTHPKATFPSLLQKLIRFSLSCGSKALFITFSAIC